MMRKNENAAVTAERRTVAIVGAGAIGSFVAAQLQGAGHTIDLLGNRESDGLPIESGLARKGPVRVGMRPRADALYHWVLVATKAQDTVSALARVMPRMREDSRIALLQNGIDHERRTVGVDKQRVVPCLVYVAAERMADRIVHHGGNRIVVPEGQAGRDFVDLMAGSGIDVVPCDDFLTVSWQKLLANLVTNPITAIAMRRLEVMFTPCADSLARDILREAVTVGRSEGARLDEGEIDQVIATFSSYAPNAGSSMLYDRLAGRQLEYEFLTGAVVEIAHERGIPVPVNRTVLALMQLLGPVQVAH